MSCPENRRTAIEEIIDRLYALPLAEFTRARNEAASELRRAGQRETAERVRALRKPTAAAAAVNRLVREHRGEVKQFLRAATMLRDAQFSGKGDRATATAQERAALERLTDIGGEAVRQTLMAAAVDDDAARQLLEARLERELEPRGFGTLLAHPRPAVNPTAATAPQTDSAPLERKRPDDGATRAALAEAKAALSAAEAEAEERRSRRRWEETHRALEKARKGLSVAEAEERQARRRRDQTRRELEKARTAAEEAELDLDRFRDS